MTQTKKPVGMGGAPASIPVPPASKVTATPEMYRLARLLHGLDKSERVAVLDLVDQLDRLAEVQAQIDARLEPKAPRRKRRKKGKGKRRGRKPGPKPSPKPELKPPRKKNEKAERAKQLLKSGLVDDE